MAKFNIFVSLQAYGDTQSSNNPALNHFKWARDSQGISADKPESLEFSLAPGESKTLFNGSRSLSHDNTTTYDLSLKTGTSNTYILEHNSGTAPLFRTPRSSGADATTQVTVTKNGTVLTFASTGGTNFGLILGGVVVGDIVSIGDEFVAANQGQFKIIALTATSFSIENGSGDAEGPITLGAEFASQIEIFSSSGVQVGDSVRISGGFSIASQDSYEVTAVYADRIEFYSTKALPSETAIQTDDINVYYSAKKLVYLESNKNVALTINGDAAGNIEPFIENNTTKPGMFLRKSSMWSMSVQNNSLETAILYLASIE